MIESMDQGVVCELLKCLIMLHLQKEQQKQLLDNPDGEPADDAKPC